MVHTLLGLLSTTNVYSALATIAKAEMMKQVAIAIHALKITKKKRTFRKSPQTIRNASNGFYCGLYQRIAIALLGYVGEITNKIKGFLLQSCCDWLKTVK